MEQTEKALRIRTEEQEVSERVVWKLHLSVVATLDFCGNGSLGKKKLARGGHRRGAVV